MGVTGEPPGLPEFLAVLRRSRTLVLGTSLAGLVAGLVAAFVMSPRYRATALMLPPDDRGLPPLTRTERESLPAGPAGPGPLELLESPAGLAARLVTSDPVLRRAAAKLGGGEDVVGWLADGTRAWVTDHKVVYVQVTGPEAAPCAAAANALVAALDEFNLMRRSAMAHSLADSLEPELGRAASDSSAAGRLLAAALSAELARARRDAIDPRPSVEMLEPAVPPDRPFAPQRGAVILAFALAGVLGGVVAAFVSGSPRRDGAASAERARRRDHAPV